MSWKVATAFTGYLASASGYQATYPPPNVAIHRFPRRPWRSPDLVGEWLQLEFSGAQPVAALYLNHTNFGQVTLKASDDRAFATFDSVGTFTVGQDSRVQNRRHAICEFTAINRRFLRLEPGTADVGATAWELGQVVAVNAYAWQPWPEPAAPPYKQTRTRAVRANELPGATRYVLAKGATYFGADFGAELWTLAQWTRIMDLLNLGLNQPFLLYENEADRTKAYMLYRTGVATISDEAGRIFGTRVPAREAI